MRWTATTIAAAFGTVALAAGVGAGLAYADPEQAPAASPSATASPSPTDKAERKDKADRKDKAHHIRRHPGLLRRALHGEATLGGEKRRVVVFQRGVVESVTETSLTVKSEDGFSGSYVLTTETRIRKDKEQASRSDIKVKDRVRVFATKDGSTLTAIAVRDHGV
jgi:hypothetical protein